jgi:hypothetical protein
VAVASLPSSFTLEHVRETPDLQGVFTLWDGDECVFVGHTPWNRSLPECLRQCLALRDKGVIHASRFAWETTSTPKGREYELLALNIEKHGRLPRYNRADSPLRPPRTSITDLRART